MFDSFIKDPNVEKSALKECIKHMASEAYAVEQQLSSSDAATTTMHEEGVPAQDDESIVADSSGPANKRARVSLS